MKTPAAVSDEGATEHHALPAFRAMPRTLYVVATPLGNLRDVTLRALDVLASADIVAAEDTRITATLLRKYGIATKAKSLHAHNEAQRAESLIYLLAAGKSVALVTDAGTPAVSDPGARLVNAARAAGYAVVPIPGPSAIIAAVSAAGIVAESFAFLGFLPRQAKARRECLLEFGALPVALVLFEAPHRVRVTVRELAQYCAGERRLIVARELTKTFETITSLPLAEAAAWFAGDPNRERGEFVLILDVSAERSDAPAMSRDAESWLVALLQELPPARAARVVAAVTGVAREIVYARALALQRGS